MVGSVGKYELQSTLGKGASSTVYLAIDTSTQRQVALKVMDAEALRDPAVGKFRRNQFLSEASLVGKLAHPHIVALLDAGTSGDPDFIAMEYVPGGNLRPYTTPATVMSVADVIEIGFKCCLALDYAFRRGIIHRDIKPANILVVSKTDIKLGDFGAALLRDTDARDVRSLGSPAYMSPEQTNGLALGYKSDMFMLGVVLFELLTGRRPFEGSTVHDIMANIRNADPAPVCELRPEVPAALEPVLMRALAKNPDARYPAWADFALDLAQVGGLGPYQRQAAPARG